MQIGVSTRCPTLPRDAGDRNRTSPFAFTGNKFEFRAVGSSQSIAGPNVVLNTIVAESPRRDRHAPRGRRQAAGKDLNAEIQAILPKLIAESKNVIFNGDGYSEVLAQAEAESRGLPNRRNTIDSIPDVISPKAIALFGKYGVLSERELHSRYEIYLENYKKTINDRVRPDPPDRQPPDPPRRDPLPGRGRPRDLGHLKAAGVLTAHPRAKSPSSNDLTATIDELQNRRHHQALDRRPSSTTPASDSMAHAKHSRDVVIPAMNAVRTAGDKLEDPRRRRPLAAADLSGDAVHQVKQKD